MNSLFLFLLINTFLVSSQNDGETIIIQPQIYPAPQIPQYQPDNGPMRGPNSIEAYKRRNYKPNSEYNDSDEPNLPPYEQHQVPYDSYVP